MTIGELEQELMALEIKGTFADMIEAWSIWSEIKKAKKWDQIEGKEEFTDGLYKTISRNRPELVPLIKERAGDLGSREYERRQKQYEERLTAIKARIDALKG